ncbi:MAG: CocE/NonD family hydrolase [Pseudomonadota bacterium]
MGADVQDLWIPLADGRQLAARLWRPGTGVPCPVILEYLPYRLRDGTAARDASNYPRFAAAGYAGLRVDIAGTGDSDGLFDDEYSPRERADLAEIVAWACAQAWCDGQVAMIGISWGGFNALQAAARGVPGLGAVVACCASVDRWAEDIHFMGGCLLSDNFNWGAQMTAYQARPPDPAVRTDWAERFAERLDALPFLAADWLARPARSSYWDHGSALREVAALPVPALVLGGWNDAYVNAPLDVVAAASAQGAAPAAALIGPWEHKYPHLSRILPCDFHAEVTGWLDRHLRGLGPPLPAARLWLATHPGTVSRRYGPPSGRWVAADRWPLAAGGGAGAEGEEQVLHPAADGTLGQGARQGQASVAPDLAVGQGAAYFCPGMRVDNELCDDQRADDARSLSFDTPPLAAPLAIVGRPMLYLRVAADRPVAQIAARLCDVARDGASARITYRPLNLCLAPNAGAGTPTEAQAVAPAPLEPGRFYDVAIPLNTCAHALAAGHRLRLALSSSYWPVLWPAPEPVTLTLDLAGTRLVLPVARGLVPADIAPAARHDGPPAARHDAPPAGPRTAHAAAPGVAVHRPPEGTASWIDGAAGDAATALPHLPPRPGETRLETVDDFGALQAPGGMLFESRVVQRYARVGDDPLSALHAAHWRFRFSRGDWSTTVETTATMRCDGEAFHLARTIAWDPAPPAAAASGMAPRLARADSRRVPRGCL